MKLNIGRLIQVKYKAFANIFTEIFESNWFINNIYNFIFIENFEEWDLGNFIAIFTDQFNQIDWVIDNLFNNISTDNFENWFTQNNYILQFNENFENGGW